MSGEAPPLAQGADCVPAPPLLASSTLKSCSVRRFTEFTQAPKHYQDLLQFQHSPLGRVRFSSTSSVLSSSTLGKRWVTGPLSLG